MSLLEDDNTNKSSENLDGAENLAENLDGACEPNTLKPSELLSQEQPNCLADATTIEVTDKLSTSVTFDEVITFVALQSTGLDWETLLVT